MLSDKTNIMPMPDSVRKAMWARLKKDWHIPENQFSINGIAVDPRTKPTEEDIENFADVMATKYLQSLSDNQIEKVANIHKLEVGDRWGKGGAGELLYNIAIDDIGSTLNEIYDKKR